MPPNLAWRCFFLAFHSFGNGLVTHAQQQKAVITLLLYYALVPTMVCSVLVDLQEAAWVEVNSYDKPFFWWNSANCLGRTSMDFKVQAVQARSMPFRLSMIVTR